MANFLFDVRVVTGRAGARFRPLRATLTSGCAAAAPAKFAGRGSEEVCYARFAALAAGSAGFAAG
jgi:hypothetical protein